MSSSEPSDYPNLRVSLNQVHQHLHELGRSDVRIIAVTKTRPIQAIKNLLALGQRDIGENRFPELRNKLASDISGDIYAGENLSSKCLPIYHYIGPLQTGNARQIPSLFSWIHGVSSIRSLNVLLESAMRQRQKEEKKAYSQRTWPMHYFIQIRLTKETTKVGGMEVEEFLGLSHYPENDALRFAGLMTMGPQSQNPQQCREVFHRLRELRDSQAPSSFLSMGMSGDWKIAVEEGSNMIRIGRLLFDSP